MPIRLRQFGLALIPWAQLFGQERAAVDHHQHLFSPGVVALVPGRKPVLAVDLVKALDSAGIRRAAVLSVAYQFGNPNLPAVEDEYAKVKAENDWTAAQAAQFPDRLRAVCSFNPLKDYALEELDRCAKDSRLRSGIKLHFGNSDAAARVVTIRNNDDSFFSVLPALRHRHRFRRGVVHRGAAVGVNAVQRHRQAIAIVGPVRDEIGAGAEPIQEEFVELVVHQPEEPID